MPKDNTNISANFPDLWKIRSHQGAASRQEWQAAEREQEAKALLMRQIHRENLNINYTSADTSETLSTKIGKLYAMRRKAQDNSVEYLAFDSVDDIAEAIDVARAELSDLALALNIPTSDSDTIEGIEQKIALTLGRAQAESLGLQWSQLDDTKTLLDRIDGHYESLLQPFDPPPQNHP